MTPTLTSLVMSLAAVAAPRSLPPVIHSLPSGAELITVERVGPPWVELRILIRIQHRPSAPAGLTWVAGNLLEEELQRNSMLRPTVRVETKTQGWCITAGVPTEHVDTSMSAIMTALKNLAPQPSQVERAVARAVDARDAIRHWDRALGRAELIRAFWGQSPLQGEIESLALITEQDVRALYRQAQFGKSVSLIVVGPSIEDLQPRAEAWTSDLLPKSPSATSPTPPVPTDTLTVVVVDKPQRTRAWIGGAFARTATIGHTFAVAATLEAALGWAQMDVEIGDGGWRMGGEASLGKEADHLLQLLELEERSWSSDDLQKGLARTDAWRRLDLRDPFRTADHLAKMRLTGRSLDGLAFDAQPSIPVLQSQLKAMVSKGPRSLVVVTGATPQLLERLVALPKVTEVRVVPWNHR